MKQILQNISNGKTDLIEVPCPKNKLGNVLIETRKTIISKGTEKMLIDFGKSSLLGKAISQPDKVKQTFGFDIAIVTTAKNREEGLVLLKQLGIPFQE